MTSHSGSAIVVLMNTEILRRVAPVVAMLRHDIAHPSHSVLDKKYALVQLEQVLDLVNAKPVPVVDTTDTEDETRILREQIQKSLERRD